MGDCMRSMPLSRRPNRRVRAIGRPSSATRASEGEKGEEETGGFIHSFE